MIEAHKGNNRILASALGMEGVMLVCSSGDILRGSDHHFERIWQHPEPLLAATFAPDQETLALVTASSVLTICPSFSPEYFDDNSLSFDLSSFDPARNLSTPATVGWGRKETQFHGSAGKAAATADTSVKAVWSDSENQAILMAWRNDGQVLAVSLPLESSRRILFFNYPPSGAALAPVAISEPVAGGLDPTLAWAGDLVASSAVHPSGRQEILFFERNGLRHGEFTANLRVSHLSWNCNGSILAVTTTSGMVQLWQMSNYRWYLKQSLPALQVFWHPESPYSFCCHQGSKSSLLYVEMTAGVARSYGLNDSLNIVAVVDGMSLLLTPFSICNIPPPMCYEEMQMKCEDGNFSISSVSTFVDGDVGLMAVAVGPVIQLYQVKRPSLESATFERIQQFSTDAFVSQALVISVTSVLVRFIDGSLASLTLDGLEWHLKRISCKDHFGLLVWASEGGNIHGGRAFLQDYEGAVYRIDGEKVSLDIIGGHFAPWLGILASDDTVVLSTNQHGTLFLNGTPIYLPNADTCTSVLVTADLVIVSTTGSALHFIPIWRMLSHDHLKQLDESSSSEERLRKTEPGATIVTVVPSASSLVLQMPRGNLETIYPRAMVLAGIRTLLDQLNYAAAYAACRRHSIDLNILYDHNPTMWEATVSQFVNQLLSGDAKTLRATTEHLNLFISTLRPESVVKTRYGLERLEAPPVPADKINRICKAIRNVLDRNNLATNVECLMATFAAQTPPDYRSALLQIVLLSEMSQKPPLSIYQEEEDTPPQFVINETIEKALEFLIFLVPQIDVLFKEALALYNLPLALSIARRSSLDPSDYVPFLEALERMPLAQRSFRIDAYLGNYARALVHLHRSIDGGLDEEILDYVRTHGLYPQAISLYGGDEAKRRILLVEYAEKLLLDGGESSARSAVTLLAMAGGMEDRILTVTLHYGFWQEGLAAAQKLSCQGEDLAGLGLSFAERLLTERRECREALLAVQAFQGASDQEPSFWEEILVNIITTGGLWADAPLLPNRGIIRLKAKAMDHSAHLSRECHQLRQEFEEMAKRLYILLTEQLQAARAKPTINNEPENPDLPDISDTFSQLSMASRGSTVRTRTTGSSRLTSTSKRTEQRQRARGKPGSPWEKEYLLDQLTGTIVGTRLVGCSLVTEASSLVRFLATCGAIDEACEFQDALDQLIQTVIGWYDRLDKEVQAWTAFGVENPAVKLGSSVLEEAQWRTAFAKLPAPLLSPWKFALFSTGHISNQ